MFLAKGPTCGEMKGLKKKRKPEWAGLEFPRVFFISHDKKDISHNS